MPAPPAPDATLRRLLNRRELAAARHRSALSRQLGLTESEMLAVAHLAQRGQLSPSELGGLLGLSSGGISALVARLQEAGHVVREAHPTDGRSNLVRLAPALVRRAGAAFAPLVTDLDQLSADLDEAERAVVRRYLERVVSLSEAHAERVREAEAHDAEAASPVPALWG
ncbi:MAG TPA: MarR family transcriptional regulator [Solirubrobacteraceae bacterium]|jgi:DNA-binding MarR family transcriptional regulator